MIEKFVMGKFRDTSRLKGRTIADVRQGLIQVLLLKLKDVALINGEPVSEDYVIQGDEEGLEFPLLNDAETQHESE